MEAKDTVMTDEKIFNAVDKWKLLKFSTDSIAKSVAQEQAEISFKAGMKEVMEWGNERVRCEHLVFYHKAKDCVVCWQAKLGE